MSLFHIVILAIVQGLTEFLPVSSSGHLVIAHAGLGSNGWQADLTLDIAVHVGTLFAVLVYFRKDIDRMLRATIAAIRGEKSPDQGEGHVLWLVILASVPVIIAGLLLHLYEPDWVRQPLTLAITTIIFGLVLWAADQAPAEKELKSLGWRGALFIGLAQIIALIPGTSRSGITMTAARYLGFTRVEAARFSLFLAIIAISGAGVLAGFSLWQSQDLSLSFEALWAAVLAFIFGWISIALMLKWLERSTFTPFAIYRLALGVVLLGLIYLGVL